MRTVAVIPSRFDSSRFPGKPLAEIAGQSMIQRVWAIATAALEKDNVFVATDSERIFDHVMAFGGQVMMTSAECRNGTERVAEAISKIEGELSTVINVQGDTPLLPHWVLEELKSYMENNPKASLATPAVSLEKKDFEAVEVRYAKGEVGGTFVTTSKSGRALYFSKSPIPSIKRMKEGSAPLKKHLGVYAYRPELLKKLVSLEPTPLERVEQLEQLRALENDIPIDVVMVDFKGRSAQSVDNPEDLKRVEAIIEEEGELV